MTTKPIPPTATAALVETPCIAVCVMDPSDGLCAGCARTLDEIARWGTMGDAERRAIMEALPGRRVRVRRGGRAARLAERRG